MECFRAFRAETAVIFALFLSFSAVGGQESLSLGTLVPRDARVPVCDSPCLLTEYAALDFRIDTPATASTSPKAMDCGVDACRDATALVRARIAALPPEGGTVRLTKGECHFYENDALPMMLSPSNNRRGEKRVVFPLAGRRNVTVDGGGSTFVFHGQTFPFAATNCANITFRNFTVTTRYPSCAGFVVTEKSDAGFTVKFDDGVCPYAVKDGHLTFSLDGHAVSTADGRLSLHAIDRLVIVYLMAPTSPGDKSKFPAGFLGVTPEDLGDRTVRFAYYGDRHAKSVKCPYNVGEKVVVNLEEKRSRDVFFFEDCDGVTVENVTMRRFGGMGIVAQRSGNLSLRHLVAEPMAGERVTLTADIVQFINCYGECPRSKIVRRRGQGFST